MTRMFISVTRTVNAQIGCLHGCSYCWAHDLALGRLRGQDKYSQGFMPRFFPDALLENYRPGEFVFFSSMGDLMGDWVPRGVIEEHLLVAREYPDTDFLLQTKNPARYLEFELPPNVYAGITIESDIDHGVSRAPSPSARRLAVTDFPQAIPKFLSIEPIMDFNLDRFMSWIGDIAPAIIEIGADNHHKHLPEPSPDNVSSLLSALRRDGLNVIEKPGLERLKQVNREMPK